MNSSISSDFQVFFFCEYELWLESRKLFICFMKQLTSNSKFPYLILIFYALFLTKKGAQGCHFIKNHFLVLERTLFHVFWVVCNHLHCVVLIALSFRSLTHVCKCQSLLKQCFLMGFTVIYYFWDLVGPIWVGKIVFSHFTFIYCVVFAISSTTIWDIVS